MFKYLCVAALSVIGISSCNSHDAGEDSLENQAITQAQVVVPQFNADSAYSFIARQVGFGPRVPNSKSHEDCASWLTSKLNEYCDTVYLQKTKVLAGDKKELPCLNIIGVINPNAKRRVLFLAHWDSRPWADQENPPSGQPIDAADDGASGVAVLMELSRVLKSNSFNKEIGIDILLVDVEDYGKTEWGEDSYALGAQYWSNNPHVSGYTAEAGILLDMVGAKNARFPQEGYSKQYAGYVLKQVWAAASKAGYSSYFTYENGGHITDDHVPVNEIRKIPTIDIINLPTGSPTGFGSHWHTHKDNMDIIDKSTLKAVGQTLLEYLYTN